jgi:hypothetical protein
MCHQHAAGGIVSQRGDFHSREYFDPTPTRKLQPSGRYVAGIMQ